MTREPWQMVKLQGESGFLLTSLPTAGKESQFWALQTIPDVEDGQSLPLEGKMSVTTLSRAQVFEIYRSAEEADLPAPAGELRYRIAGSIDDPDETQFSGELLLDRKPVLK